MVYVKTFQQNHAGKGKERKGKEESLYSAFSHQITYKALKGLVFLGPVDTPLLKCLKTFSWVFAKYAWTW